MAQFYHSRGASPTKSPHRDGMEITARIGFCSCRTDGVHTRKLLIPCRGRGSQTAPVPIRNHKGNLPGYRTVGGSPPASTIFPTLDLTNFPTSQFRCEKEHARAHEGLCDIRTHYRSLLLSRLLSTKDLALAFLWAECTALPLVNEIPGRNPPKSQPGGSLRDHPNGTT